MDANAMVEALREERWVRVCVALWRDEGGAARRAWATPVVQDYIRALCEALHYAREEAGWDDVPYTGLVLEDDPRVGWLYRASPPSAHDRDAWDGMITVGDDVWSAPQAVTWEGLEARGGAYAYPDTPERGAWDVIREPGGAVFEPFAHNPDRLYKVWRAFTGAAERLATPEALVGALAAERWVGLRVEGNRICRVSLGVSPWAWDAGEHLAPW